jgi:hypothetical protein
LDQYGIIVELVARIEGSHGGYETIIIVRYAA